MEYVEHPVAFVPTPTTFIENNSQGSSIPENTPLDVTMLAMMGLSLAGAGMMKTQTAQKKQQEQAQANAVAQAQLALAQAEQKLSAQENYAKNQTMQAEAKQKVYTKVTQSQANIDFWASYTAWQIAVAKAEEKRRQAELEAQIQAYYAALRLRPISPTRPTAPGLTNTRNRGNSNQGQKGNRNTRNNTGSSTTISTGAVGGGFGGGSWGGGHGLTISSDWDNLQVNQSQQGNICDMDSDLVEFLGYAVTGLNLLYHFPWMNASPTSGFLTNMADSYLSPGFSLRYELECGTTESYANTASNIGILLGFASFGIQMGLVGFGVVLLKELIAGIGPISLRGTTVEAYESGTGIKSSFTCPDDGLETVGDSIVGFVRKFYPLGALGTWDDMRHSWDENNPQPISYILESDDFEILVQDLLDSRQNDLALDPPLSPGTRVNHILGYVRYFESQFSGIVMENPVSPSLSGSLTDTIHQYPLLANATLLHYLSANGLLDDDIKLAIGLNVMELGIDDPLNDFINPIINNTPEFYESTQCD